MKLYRITISADRYPTEWSVEATSWATAVARAIRLWQKRFKGSRTEELRVTAVKGGAVIRESETAA